MEGPMSDDEIRDQFDQIRSILTETASIQREQARALLAQSKRMLEFDEGMDRIRRHLEVLIDIVDGMIRDQGKKR